MVFVVSVAVVAVSGLVVAEVDVAVLSPSRSPGFSVITSGSSVVVVVSSGASVVVVVPLPSRSVGSSRDTGSVVPVVIVGAGTVVVISIGGQLPHRIGQIFLTAAPTISLVHTLACRGHVCGSPRPLHFPPLVVPVVVVVVPVVTVVVIVVVDVTVNRYLGVDVLVSLPSKSPGSSVTTAGSSVVVVDDSSEATVGVGEGAGVATESALKNSPKSTIPSKLVSKSVMSSSEVKTLFPSTSALGNKLYKNGSAFDKIMAANS